MSVRGKNTTFNKFVKRLRKAGFRVKVYAGIHGLRVCKFWNKEVHGETSIMYWDVVKFGLIDFPYTNSCSLPTDKAQFARFIEKINKITT